MAKLPKTILHFEVNDNKYLLRTNASVRENQEKSVYLQNCKHQQRLIQVLAESDDVFHFFEQIYEPVRRFRRREARKKLKMAIVNG